MTAERPLPLVTLQPVIDASQAWVALLLDAATPLDGAALAQVVHDRLLIEILTDVALVATVDPRAIDAALGNDLPRERVILRFPVDLGCAPELQPALAALRAAGFGLMATGLPAPGQTLAAEIASLAIPCPSLDALPSNEALKSLPGPHLGLGMTTPECPGFCKFQWLACPVAAQVAPASQGDPTARARLLKLLTLVTQDAESGEIETLIKQDANLAYKLLKLVNSVAFMPGRQIANFTQALVLLGRRQLQRWLMLLLFAHPPGEGRKDPLLPQAALRARLMEELAKRLGRSRDEADHAFMIGMFSLLDRLFGTPLGEIVAPLHLPDDVTQALLAGAGRFAPLLAAVTASETSPATALEAALGAAGIGHADWNDALAEAARWAVMISKEA